MWPASPFSPNICISLQLRKCWTKSLNYSIVESHSAVNEVLNCKWTKLWQFRQTPLIPYFVLHDETDVLLGNSVLLWAKYLTWIINCWRWLEINPLSILSSFHVFQVALEWPPECTIFVLKTSIEMCWIIYRWMGSHEEQSGCQGSNQAEKAVSSVRVIQIRGNDAQFPMGTNSFQAQWRKRQKMGLRKMPKCSIIEKDSMKTEDTLNGIQRKCVLAILSYTTGVVSSFPCHSRSSACFHLLNTICM